ncbi:MAG: hypothetical protein GX937_03970 [Lentisphaerae bacterium]|nr:hypothetical protein [Lentisphaerota bacterium]
MKTANTHRKISSIPDFWESPSLEELALRQNVQPLANVRALFGTWPGDDDDGFEASIDELRHREIDGGRKNKKSPRE